MATLGLIRELYKNGALNIKGDKNTGIATLGGVNITEEQAAVIAGQLGWTKYVLHPFDIVEKTAKFIKAFDKFEDLEVLNDIVVDFQNNRSSVYGKTFDRIHLELPRKFSLSIQYGMPSNESPYVIYDSFTSVPLKRCRNMKQVVEFLNTKL